MFKKMFALASVTALTGLVTSVAASGCSSTNSVSDEGGTSTEGGGKEAGPPKEAGQEEETGPSTCPTTDPIDQTTAPWKPPAVAQGSCTNAQIDEIVKYIDDNPKTEYSKLKASVTDPVCKACLFVKDGTNWGVFVEKADGTFLRNNFGGCVAVLSGKESCGKAFSQYDDCLTFACQDCEDQASFDKCGSPAAKGACKGAATALTTECPSVDPISACDDLATKYLFEAAARALCVGTGDGGVDGGDGG